jgi:hypothetical protein
MVQQVQGSSRSWTTRRDEKQRRLRSVSSWMKGAHLPRDKLVESLQMLIAPGDRIVLEGDNHRGGGKPADFGAAAEGHSNSHTQPPTLQRKPHDEHLYHQRWYNYLLAELREDNQTLAARLREVHDVVDEVRDIATASLIENWLDETERRTWFLFESSRRGEMTGR